MIEIVDIGLEIKKKTKKSILLFINFFCIKNLFLYKKYIWFYFKNKKNELNSQHLKYLNLFFIYKTYTNKLKKGFMIVYILNF
jgi:hypothetical protein